MLSFNPVFTDIKLNTPLTKVKTLKALNGHDQSQVIVVPFSRIMDAVNLMKGDVYYDYPNSNTNTCCVLKVSGSWQVWPAVYIEPNGAEQLQKLHNICSNIANPEVATIGCEIHVSSRAEVIGVAVYYFKHKREQGSWWVAAKPAELMTYLELEDRVAKEYLKGLKGDQDE